MTAIMRWIDKIVSAVARRKVNRDPNYRPR